MIPEKSLKNKRETIKPKASETYEEFHVDACTVFG